jgi:hypothetical protein
VASGSPDIGFSDIFGPVLLKDKELDKPDGQEEIYQN